MLEGQRFQYGEFDADKHRVLRNDGAIYINSSYGCILFYRKRKDSFRKERRMRHKSSDLMMTTERGQDPNLGES